MRCQTCNTELALTAKFCASCGAAVASSSQPFLADRSLQGEKSMSYGNTSQRLDLPDPNVNVTGHGTTGMEYKIIGTTMQAVILELDPGETVYSEGGGMAWMSGNIGMQTNTRGSGLGGMFKRALTGESLFLNEFTSHQGKGMIAFASDFPGKIVPVMLDVGQSMIVQKQAFLCAEKTVTMEIHFRKKLGSGFFGGEGFIMQKLTGPGVAFVCLDGEIMEYTLEQDQIIKVDTGHVAMYEPTIDMDIEMLRGFKNVLFGGEGLFLTTLRGPGRIWLQTMPTMSLAKAIAPYLTSSSAGSASGNVAGDIIGGLFNK